MKLTNEARIGLNEFKRRLCSRFLNPMMFAGNLTILAQFNYKHLIRRATA